MDEPKRRQVHVFINERDVEFFIYSGYALYSTSRKMQLSDFAVYRTTSLRLRSGP